MTVRDAIVSAVPVLIVAALAFGPIGAWLANRRARNPAVWLVLAAITGPLGIALLLAAPPGRCPWCGEPTVGFEATCFACGESTRHSSGRALDAARPAIPAAAVSAEVVTISPPALGPPTEQPAADHEPVAVGPGRPAAKRATASGAARSARSGRSSKARAMDSGGDRLEAIGAHRPADTVPEPPAPLEPADTAAAAPVGTPAIATIPGTGTPLRAGLSILAIGVFVQGSENLLPGARYLLARTATSLVVVGPLEASTSHAELNLPLDRVEATSVTDRLVVTGWEAGRGRRWVLGFQSVNELGRTPIDQALRAAPDKIEALAKR